MYFVSDWAILNDTTSKQLRRILAEFHHLTESEIHLACVLLESYHAVYRRDRLEQRRNQFQLGQARIKEPCLPPTANQLDEIAQRVNAKATLSVGTEDVLTQLQNLVKRLRQYRIYVRGGLGGTASLDEPNARPNLHRLQSSDSTNHQSDRDEPAKFLALPNGRIQGFRCESTQTRKNGRSCGG